MKILFLGTPDFAVPCLQTIAKQEEVLAVYTQPDKPKGRGYKLIPTPVKKAAMELDIPVFQPISLRKGEEAEAAFAQMKSYEPDLIVVVAYGQILPKHILELPKYGCINIHASLLPRWRGAAPIQRCILEGDTVTGVTSMQMAEGLDTGDMLVKRSISIGENETAGELHDRLAELGAWVLQETIDKIKEGSLQPEVQNEAETCYAKMLTKDLSALDLSKSAQELHNVVRGVTGFAYLDGKRLKIYRSHIESGKGKGEPGALQTENALLLTCGDGTILSLDEIQIEGGKRMQAKDFLRGYRFSNQAKLEMNLGG